MTTTVTGETLYYRDVARRAYHPRCLWDAVETHQSLRPGRPYLIDAPAPVRPGDRDCCSRCGQRVGVPVHELPAATEEWLHATRLWRMP